jgi:hypothetical protein
MFSFSNLLALLVSLPLLLIWVRWLRTKLYDKWYDFNFPIVNFPFICSNIPAAPAYGVYASQLIRYPRAYGSYHNFRDNGFLLTRKLLNQGLRNICHKRPRTCSICRNHNLELSSFMTYHRVCSKSNMTGATSGADSHSGATEHLIVWFVLLDL